MVPQQQDQAQVHDLLMQAAAHLPGRGRGHQPPAVGSNIGSSSNSSSCCCPIEEATAALAYQQEGHGMVAPTLPLVMAPVLLVDDVEAARQQLAGVRRRARA